MESSETAPVSGAARAFRIHAEDNVATLLEDVRAGDGVAVIGVGAGRVVVAGEAVAGGHKIALEAIASGEGVRKYGVRIGHATERIEPGRWVHLQNCASDYDERSSTLDLDTGAPTDTAYR